MASRLVAVVRWVRGVQAREAARVNWGQQRVARARPWCIMEAGALAPALARGLAGALAPALARGRAGALALALAPACAPAVLCCLPASSESRCQRAMCAVATMVAARRATQARMRACGAEAAATVGGVVVTHAAARKRGFPVKEGPVEATAAAGRSGACVRVGSSGHVQAATGSTAAVVTVVVAGTHPSTSARRPRGAHVQGRTAAPPTAATAPAATPAAAPAAARGVGT